MSLLTLLVYPSVARIVATSSVARGEACGARDARLTAAVCSDTSEARLRLTLTITYYNKNLHFYVGLGHDLEPLVSNKSYLSKDIKKKLLYVNSCLFFHTVRVYNNNQSAILDVPMIPSEQTYSYTLQVDQVS